MGVGETNDAILRCPEDLKYSLQRYYIGIMSQGPEMIVNGAV